MVILQIHFNSLHLATADTRTPFTVMMPLETVCINRKVVNEIITPQTPQTTIKTADTNLRHMSLHSSYRNIKNITECTGGNMPMISVKHWNQTYDTNLIVSWWVLLWSVCLIFFIRVLLSWGITRTTALLYLWKENNKITAWIYSQIIINSDYPN